MKVVEDVAGRRLTLKGDGTVVPGEVLPFLFILPLPLFAIPLFLIWRELRRPATADGEIVLFMAGWVVALIVILGKAWSSLRDFPALFDIDRDAGVARLGRGRTFGGEIDQTVFGLDRIRRVTVLREAPSERGASGLQVAFHLAPMASAPAAPPSEVARMAMSVEALGEAKDVVAFALRLGTAAGLAHSRVVRNDPRAVEVELASEAPSADAPGPAAALAAAPATPAPTPAPSADIPLASATPEALAARATAAVAKETVETFDPAHFEGVPGVQVWEPGRRVVLHDSFGCGWVLVAGCLAVLAGPLAYLWLSGTSEAAQEIAERTGAVQFSILAGVIGLVIAGGCAGMIPAFLPTRVDLDWTRRTLSFRKGRRGVAIPMDSIAAIEVACIHEMTGRKVVIHRYHCEVRARWRGTDDQEETTPLTETYENDEPDPPYRGALPLATELARALGVERKVLDYDSGPRLRPRGESPRRKLRRTLR